MKAFRFAVPLLSFSLLLAAPAARADFHYEEGSLTTPRIGAPKNLIDPAPPSAPAFIAPQPIYSQPQPMMEPASVSVTPAPQPIKLSGPVPSKNMIERGIDSLLDWSAGTAGARNFEKESRNGLPRETMVTSRDRAEAATR